MKGLIDYINEGMLKNNVKWHTDTNVPTNNENILTIYGLAAGDNKKLSYREYNLDICLAEPDGVFKNPKYYKGAKEYLELVLFKDPSDIPFNKKFEFAWAEINEPGTNGDIDWQEFSSNLIPKNQTYILIARKQKSGYEYELVFRRNDGDFYDLGYHLARIGTATHYAAPLNCYLNNKPFKSRVLFRL